MNSVQLEIILKKHPKTSTKFIGVYARDELPVLRKFPCCFILNTAKRTHEGKHWLAFYFDTKKRCYFFDSYGNKPDFFNLENYIKKLTNKVIYNKKIIQSWSSQNCGFYCVIFLILKSSNYSMKTITNQFSDICEENDEKINKLKNFF